MIKKIFKKKVDFEKIRKDFPVLNKKINNKPIIYFDSACMSLRPKQVIEKINEYYYQYPACAGRSNHALAEQVTKEMENSRNKVAKFYGAKNSKDVVFTKNTTEAINLVANSFNFQKSDVVLTTDKEHNSNLIPWLKLQKKKIIKHDFIDSTETNEFSLDNLKEKLNKHNGKVKLVSVVFTSNLDGVTNPVEEIVKIAHKHNAKVLLDCSQSSLHHKISIKKIKADFIAVSSHKVLGPNGVGALISTAENLKKLDQFLVGGETVLDSFLDGNFEPEKVPSKFEAGLQNYPGIIAFGEAVDYLENIGGPEKVNEHISMLNKLATEELSKLSKVHILGPEDANKRSGIFSFVIEGKNNHEVSLLLNNMHNIMVRSGAHCVHAWFNKKENENSVFGKGTVRASFGPYNTVKEVEHFVKAVKEISEL